MGGGRAGGSFWTLPKCCPTQRGLFDVVFSVPGKSIPSRRCRGEATCSPRPGAPASNAPSSSGAALRFCLSKTASGVNGGELPNRADPACREKHPFRPAPRGSNLLPSAGRSCIRRPTQQRGCSSVLLEQNRERSEERRTAKQRRPSVPGKASLPAGAGGKRLAPLGRAPLHPTAYPAAGLLSGFALAKPESGANGGELPNSAGPACRGKHPFRPAQRGSSLLPSAECFCIRCPTQQRGCSPILP